MTYIYHLHSFQRIEAGFMKIVLQTLCFTISLSASCQTIDNMASYRSSESVRYVKLHYENDFFSMSDEYYTQGINIEFVNPSVKRIPLSKLLPTGNDQNTLHGISIEHLGYTPTSITHPEVLLGDRPFAASLFLKTFSVVNDSLRGSRLMSSISTGVIGPAAGGKEMQTSIHRWIHGTKPLGWENQISNDVILNYQITYERKLIPYMNYFSVSYKGGFLGGTLNDKLYAGLSLIAGIFDNPFQFFTKQKRRFQIYVYAEPVLNLVGYDASLQGGLFNRSSMYTISSGDMNRIVFQNNAGLMVKVNRLNLEYFQSFITKEFKTQSTHRWGGLRLGWVF